MKSILENSNISRNPLGQLISSIIILPSQPIQCTSIGSKVKRDIEFRSNHNPSNPHVACLSFSLIIDCGDFKRGFFTKLADKDKCCIARGDSREGITGFDCNGELLNGEKFVSLVVLGELLALI
jgi:hypothetical protein